MRPGPGLGGHRHTGVLDLDGVEPDGHAPFADGQGAGPDRPGPLVEGEWLFIDKKVHGIHVRFGPDPEGI